MVDNSLLNMKIEFLKNFLFIKYLGFVKSNPEPGVSPDEIIDHSNLNTRVIENFNIRQQPTTIGLSNQNINNNSLLIGNNLFNSLDLDDKLLNNNFNGPIQPSLLKNLPGGINFKQKNNEIEEKANSFLKKGEKDKN